MRVSTHEEIEALSLLDDLDYEPDHAPRTASLAPWNPDLNPTQQLAFDDPAPYILLHSEKGTGKSCLVAHKLVRHCYENYDALGLIVTKAIRTGTFGLVEELEKVVLPAWENGMGLEWLPSRLDPLTKDRVLKVGNRFGGWSTILQISMQYESHIEGRIKGIAPSFIGIDELTDLEGPGYFTKLAMQLNRRRHITGPQQYVGACNPKGPSNWVYQTFFEQPTNPDTGERDPKFSIYHLPYRENAHRPELKGYLDQLESLCKSDPIERARLIEGKWIERPTGAALFKEYYVPDRHVVGDARLGTGLVPVRGFPVVIGFDVGQIFHAAVFLQYVPVTQPTGTWMAFDEIVHIKEKLTFKQLAIEVVERMIVWNSAMNYSLAWELVTDDSAVNQWRPGSGSYDAWEFEREFNREGLLRGWGELKMRGCPKGSGSVEARVRLLQGKLHQDAFLVSATCPYVMDMLLMLEGRENEALKPKKTAAGHIHVFDALTYPLLRLELMGSPFLDPSPPVRVTGRLR